MKRGALALPFFFGVVSNASERSASFFQRRSMPSLPYPDIERAIAAIVAERGIEPIMARYG